MWRKYENKKVNVKVEEKKVKRKFINMIQFIVLNIFYNNNEVNIWSILFFWNQVIKTKVSEKIYKLYYFEIFILFSLYFICWYPLAVYVNVCLLFVQKK